MKHSVLDAEELAVGKREEVPVCVWGGFPGDLLCDS